MEPSTSDAISYQRTVKASVLPGGPGRLQRSPASSPSPASAGAAPPGYALRSGEPAACSPTHSPLAGFSLSVSLSLFSVLFFPLSSSLSTSVSLSFVLSFFFFSYHLSLLYLFPFLFLSFLFPYLFFLSLISFVSVSHFSFSLPLSFSAVWLFLCRAPNLECAAARG